MNLLGTLEQAIALAAKAHEGQIDKAGAPYILHPLRVMLAVQGAEERIVAVLHDVVEDCDVTPAALKALGFSDSVLAALDAVTKREGEDYGAFVARALENPVGRAVKRADILDNLDLSRIASPTSRDMARIEKYRQAMMVLDGKSA